TLRAIEHSLVSDSLVYRYRLGDEFSDGLGGDEGTFSICSFLYVECLSRLGDLEQGRFFFQKIFGYANHLHLYREQLGPRRLHPSHRHQRRLQPEPPALGRRRHHLSGAGFLRLGGSPRDCSTRVPRPFVEPAWARVGRQSQLTPTLAPKYLARGTAPGGPACT